MQKDDIRIKHMLDAAKKAVQFVEGKERSDLDSDEMLFLAEVRLIEIIGEAAARVTDETQAKFPKVPWKQVVATRNRLIHGYFNIDQDVIWSILRNDLPRLIEELNREK